MLEYPTTVEVTKGLVIPFEKTISVEDSSTLENFEVDGFNAMARNTVDDLWAGNRDSSLSDIDATDIMHMKSLN